MAMVGLMQHRELVITHIIDYAARWHGEQEIVTLSEEDTIETSTYADLHKRSQLCALALEQLGVGAGDVVATMAWNTARHLECWYGIMGLSAVCHTLNPRLFRKELQYIITLAEDKYIMADPSFVKLLEDLQPDMSNVKGYILLTDEAHMPKSTSLRNAMCYETLLLAAAPRLPFKWRVTNERAACGMCFTSGTTGNPKGVVYSHRSNTLHALMSLLPDNLALSAGDTLLMVVPMYHANAWGLVFAPLMAGAKLVLPGPKLDGRSLYDLMASQRVTCTAGVPTVWVNLLDHLRQNKLRLEHLQRLVIGGAAASKALITAFTKEFGITVLHLWGMTETSPIGSLSGPKACMGPLTWEQQLALKAKQGRPHMFLDMRIVNDHGKELPHDGKASGNLEVRGPIAVQRYLKADKPAVDKDGWFETGDVATIDKHGFMAIVDRSKDVIKSGGEWISSIEVENAASGHPKVAVAAVIGMPHNKWGERPLLVVQSRDSAAPPSSDEMRHYLKGKIASWWVPDQVLTLSGDETIPLTATGKISKKELRKQLSSIMQAKL